MKNYIGVVAVTAQVMTRGEYNDYRGWVIPPEENPEDKGYLCTYPDGHLNWMPKDSFDNTYLELDDPSTITENTLNRFVGPDAFESMKLDEKTSLVKVTTRSGFVEYEASSCVDPANFDHVIGSNIALGRIKDRLWPHLAFVLQWAIFGLKPLPEAEGVTDADSPQPVQ